MRFSLEHIGLPAKDPVALRDWYVKVLGAKVRYENGNAAPSLLIQMAGETMIEIYPGNRGIPDTNDNKLNGFRHLALRVDSIEAAKAALEKHGVRFTKPIDPAVGGGRVLFFEDIEGNLLHFVERSADSPVK